MTKKNQQHQKVEHDENTDIWKLERSSLNLTLQFSEKKVQHSKGVERIHTPTFTN
jgi:hypothetical protein